LKWFPFLPVSSGEVKASKELIRKQALRYKFNRNEVRRGVGIRWRYNWRRIIPFQKHDFGRKVCEGMGFE
jgi:hypothetical protein